MKRINLPLILDTLFTALCAFLLFFTAIRFYTKNVYIAFVFAIPACILFGALAFIYISKKQNKKLLISLSEKQKNQLSLHLSLSSDDYICNLFEKCLKPEDGEAKISGGKVYSGDSVYFFFFTMQALSEDDVAKVIKFSSEQKKVIFCCKTSFDALRLAENFMIEIKQIDYIYSLLKENDLLPEKYIYESPKKSSVWKIIKGRFSKKICASLFWSGAALMFLSYFTFFPIYYIASGGIMLILSAVSLVIT